MGGMTILAMARPIPGTVITKEIEEERRAWEKRQLQQRYTAVFIDALFVKMRRGDKVSADAVYTVGGIDDEGHREILEFYLGAKESAGFWKEVLLDLKERGVEQVLLFVFDGLSGLEQVIAQIYPQACQQLCVVHQVRNTLNKVRPKDKEVVAQKLKEVYRAKTVSEAKQKLLRLREQTKAKYPRLLNRWFEKIESLMRYLEFPEYLRPHLYSTNWLERLNKDFRKVLKNKNALPTEEAVRNLIYLKIRDLSKRYNQQRLNGFVAYRVDLDVLWEKYYPD